MPHVTVFGFLSAKQNTVLLLIFSCDKVFANGGLLITLITHIVES